MERVVRSEKNRTRHELKVVGRFLFKYVSCVVPISARLEELTYQ